MRLKHLEEIINIIAKENSIPSIQLINEISIVDNFLKSLNKSERKYSLLLSSDKLINKKIKALVEIGKLIHWNKIEFMHEDLKKKESYADQLIITESFLIDTYSKDKYLPNFFKAKKIYLIKNIEFLLNGIIYIDNEYINLIKYKKWKDKNLISSAECKVEEINPKDLITKT